MLGLLILDLFVWLMRLLEVTITNPYEAPRRQASAQLVLGLQVLLLWLVGWCLIVVGAPSDALAAAVRCDLCVLFMWLGAGDASV